MFHAPGHVTKPEAARAAGARGAATPERAPSARQRAARVQATLGNQAALRMRGAGGGAAQCGCDEVRLRAKLAVSTPGDACEQEADAVAERVLRGGDAAIAPRDGAPSVQRTCAECDEERRVQRQEAPGAGAPAPSLHAAELSAATRAGAPLPGDVRRRFEPRFGHDFGSVRVHTDAAAAASAHAIGALAYTHGHDIVFASGRYAPGTAPGDRLLAHELTHVVQARGAPAGAWGGAPPNHPSDPLERDADRVADRVARGEPAGAVSQAPRAFVGCQQIPQQGQGDAALDPVQSALARLHALVGGGPDQQREVLRILRGLPGETLLSVVAAMRLSGDWRRFARGPTPDLDAQVALEMSVDENVGYLTRGDTVRIEVVDLGNTTSANVDLQQGAGATDPDASRWPGSVAYDVRDGGIRPMGIHALVPVAGMLPQDAAEAIAHAYEAELAADRPYVRLRITGRGPFYAGLRQPTGEVFFESIPAAPSPQRAARGRFIAFSETIRGNDRVTLAALHLFLDWIEQHDASPELETRQPRDVWSEALDRARADAEASSGPMEPFLALSRTMLGHMRTAAPEERDRIRDALGRYDAWLDRHRADPLLSRHDPADIWARAYSRSFMAQLDAPTQGAAAGPTIDWEGVRAKLTAAVALMSRAVWPVSETVTAEDPTQLSTMQTADGEPHVRGYLLQASDREREARSHVARSFLDEMMRRATQPDFLGTTAAQDFEAWLRGHPQEQMEVMLTSARPDVDEYAADMHQQAWQNAAEAVVGFIPIVGNVVGAYEAIGGTDLFGHPLTTPQRVILGLFILLPAAARIFRVGRGVVNASRIAADFHLNLAEANALYRAALELRPGSRGAALVIQAAEDVRGGRPVSPARLHRVQELVDRTGLADARTAEAMAGHGADLADAAERELAQFGELTPETEQLLRDDPGLRRALLDCPLAARVLKYCHSPCWPTNATPEQIHAMQVQLERLSRSGTLDELRLNDWLALDSVRNDLNGAILTLRGLPTASALNARITREIALATSARGGIRVPGAAEQAARNAMVERAERIGTSYGRAQAVTDGLVATDFQSPFRGGRYGQGIDDIYERVMPAGQRNILFVLEFKGGTSRLDGDQMQLAWIVRKIQELQAHPDGRVWANRLAWALRRGELHGRVYATRDIAHPVSVMEDFWEPYPAWWIQGFPY